jgi:ppGpp synthetase/RelA/SpoT-type nucleotidyltranferase
MALIEDFINRYRKEYDFYDQAGRLVAQLLDSSLQSAGIRAIVTSRAKSPRRLEDKVRKRHDKKHYKTLDDIYSDIIDLAGARVALYFPADRNQVGKLIEDSFTLVTQPKTFPSSLTPTYEKRFSGYWATHYRVRLRETTLSEVQRRYVDAVVEIQVASVLMHAWAEVEHDLVYKPEQGRLSDDEYAILDQLNGLVLAGEIALERLQKAGETRIAARERRFANHYELAAYLLDKAASVLKGPAPESAIGRVDLLYSLLNKLELATPQALEIYLSALSGDTERRPLAEQIVDQLLAEDDARYRLYEEIKAARDRISLEEQEGIAAPEAQQAIGLFLTRWIELERLIRQIVFQRTGEHRAVLPTNRMLERSQISNVRTRTEIEAIRRLRNNLVHGIEIPDQLAITEAASRLESILEELRQALQN